MTSARVRATLVNMNIKQITGAIQLATGEAVPSLAKKHGYTKQAFYDVIKGRTSTPSVRLIISNTIDIPISDIWPDQQATKEAA